MRLTASDIFNVYRPTLCALRVYLREQRIPEAEASVFEEILRTLGQRHEQNHLATLGTFEDLGAVSPDQRAQRTTEAIRNHVPVIYQGELACDTVLGGTHVASFSPSPLSVRYFSARSGSVPGYDDGEGLKLESPLAQSAFSPLLSAAWLKIAVGIAPAAAAHILAGATSQ